MKIDFHVHARERSGCSISSEEDILEFAIKVGLDALFFSDHDRLISQQRLKELNEKYKPFRVFGGIEVSVEDEHCVVLGVHDEILEQRGWKYEDLHRFARENEGFIILAHPYRYKNTISINIDEYPPDAVEIHSTNIGRCDEKEIKKLIKKLGSRPVCSSDAHEDKHVGIYYSELKHDARECQDILKMLRDGDYTWSGMGERISRFNSKVQENEMLIKKYIEEGKDRDCYKRVTGNWEGQFDRVAMGKSYMI